MFAPQYFAQPQAMVPGYVQPMPIYQTPEQGLKRDHSPLASLIAEQEGKRVRILSGDQTLNESGSSNVAVRELTIADVLTEMKKLATKDDIAQIKSSIVAQSAEIEELRSEIGRHHERIKSLEEQASIAVVEAEKRTRPEVNIASNKQHGGAQSGPAGDFQTRRRSIIMHGLNKVKDEDLIETVLDVCQAIDVIVFASDIENISRLSRLDTGTNREVPVRVTFQLSYMRDKILRNKKDLAPLHRFEKLFINPEAPHEIRRN